MADIFISFRTDDTRRVKPVHDALRERGFSLFWSNDIPKGVADYQTIVIEEIKRARVVLVVWTRESAKSQPVAQECSQAVRDNKLVQLVLDDIEPIHFPMEAGFKAQKTMLHGWSGDTRNGEWLKLVSALESRIGFGVHSEQLPSPGSGKSHWFRDFEGAPKMVVIPAGQFTMGHDVEFVRTGSAIAPITVTQYANCSPSHTVTIPRPFAMGRFAVTFDEWDAAGLPIKPDDRNRGRGRRPVINVSWDQAQAYIAWLSGRSGKRYRLPSEAEWEYACKAGTGRVFSFPVNGHPTKDQSGCDFTTEGVHANCHGANGETVGLVKFIGQWMSGTNHTTVEVGSYQPNAFGLYDMHGNVDEWCEDAWHNNYKGAPADGSAWESPKSRSRVCRGGSYVSTLRGCSAYSRGAGQQDSAENWSGFRVVRSI